MKHDEHYLAKLGDFIEELKTPYGTTKFAAGERPGFNNQPDRPPGRWVEAVDPFNDRERMEANDNAFPQYPGTHDLVKAETVNDRPPTTVTVAGQAVPFLPKDDNLQFRNSFYWDKEQMAHHAGDYTKATIYNWLTVTADKVTSVLASKKEPLEGRVWFNYPGQRSAHGIGTISTPGKMVRAVETPFCSHSPRFPFVGSGKGGYANRHVHPFCRSSLRSARVGADGRSGHGRGARRRFH